jgi:hypothetical protein
MSGPEPNWEPLERLAQAAAEWGVQLDPDDFMWMGSVVPAGGGVSIERYKHRDTRRYLNVDAGGHTYRYLNGGYELHQSPAAAIAHVQPLTVGYQCWTNADAQFARPYRPGDRLVRGWAGVAVR